MIPKVNSVSLSRHLNLHRPITRIRVATTGNCNSTPALALNRNNTSTSPSPSQSRQFTTRTTTMPPNSKPTITTQTPLTSTPHRHHLRPPTTSFSTLRPGPLLYQGVYKELSSMKHQKPWMQAVKERDEALRKARVEGGPVVTVEGGVGRVEDVVVPKRMRDSFHSLTIPFTKDEWLVDTYVNANGQLRMGSLFQDLDALAGVIAYKHTGPAPAIVTAAVDRISIISPMVDKFYDLELSGFVSYVGRSSMEISIEVRKVDCPAGEEPLLLTCAFTMVALDPVTKKAVKINPLIVETEEEKRIFGKGEAYKNSKKALADASLTKVTPNDEESDIIHGLWMQNQKLKGLPHPPTNPHLMSTTKIHSTFLMQPQNRNRHSFMIFGGLLLKLTFELAFCCASSSTNSRPTFISLDPSTFLSPVPVGAVLYLTATIAYAEPASREEGGGTKVQVRVESRVKDVDGGGSGKEKRETETGVFNYTFRVEEEGWEVMPVTYGEFMDYVDARRRVGLQKELGVHNVDGTSSGIIKGKL